MPAGEPYGQFGVHGWGQVALGFAELAQVVLAVWAALGRVVLAVTPVVVLGQAALRVLEIREAHESVPVAIENAAGYLRVSGEC